MTADERRAQILAIAAQEFALGGLHGTSTETIARRAGITQAYVFRLFGSKRALFIQVVRSAFEQLTGAMREAAGELRGLDALSAMGTTYDALLGDRTALLLQLQGFAAASEPEVRDAVRESFAGMWRLVADTTGLDPVTVKTFLAFGMLLNNGAALELRELEEPWAQGVRTRIQPGLFTHITSETNQ
ncbi:transcriptional regulator, TetR family [Catenulispora acidiphila DSM 44928]|uniref:Transcriptional regulator, TetR family n=1 Tax=Catenulispora acidiphila (strain DSM 44928 / JCM 14897 / NBRC 102108 / NRRL B-24433 / ID139908) TaxID=479433 RepID=C7PXY3_CATAD|nr:TetR/AcrR family transcriptional regulator [Catenulispora acidiphila]ACU73443.1 transcriptional regulator, TetR family [Catenulispora acidiphila DSM 44928]